MPPDRFLPDAEFAPALIGARIRFTTLLSAVVVVIVAVVVPVLILRERHPPPWPAFVAAWIAPVVLAVVWFLGRIRCYRMVEDELRIELPFRTVRFSLAGLQSVTPDRDALRRKFKIAGNDGLGSISGRFRSKHLGPFRAYVSDGEHAVVLRWPDRCLVISPQQHSLFVEVVRKRAGLGR
jgi:hypothetical protein